MKLITFTDTGGKLILKLLFFKSADFVCRITGDTSLGSLFKLLYSQTLLSIPSSSSVRLGYCIYLISSRPLPPE